MPQNLSSNKSKTIELYVGEEYIQHNPHVGDGKEPFIEYFEKMYNEEDITMDFFRFDSNDKIVEHWDSIQKIPENSLHENRMY